MQRGAAVNQDTANQTRPSTQPPTAVPGLEYERFFTREGIDPFDEVEWDLRSAVIGSEKGEVVFEQRDVEIPKSWSQQATNIVVSKYFRGQIGTPERERSVKQLIGRVVETITAWAIKQRYFASDEDQQAFSDDLKHLLSQIGHPQRVDVIGLPITDDAREALGVAGFTKITETVEGFRAS